MKIKFLGAAQTVTGSCHLVEHENHKLLVDCGMFQGPKELKERNYREFIFNPSEIEYVLLTHAHIDHSGMIPKLIKKGFRGEILATTPTADLCEILLPDCGHIQEMECERKNKNYRRRGRKLIQPIYTAEDAHNSISQFKRVEYDNVVQLFDNMKICFRNAGHIMGSAMIEIFTVENGKEMKTVFSGDIGNKNQPIVEDPYIQKEVDNLVLESTYGNRAHGNRDLDKKREKLKEVILSSLKKGGNLIVPAFAVERTQDLLLDINILLQKKEIPEFPIYVDSPLAISATEIFQRNDRYFDEIAHALNLGGKKAIHPPNLKFARSVEDSMRLNKIKGGVMIISASGMCEAGRIKYHLKHNLWRRESTVVFVGYQAEGTLGRRLISGEKIVRIHGKSIAVKAEIVNLEGFSAHIDQPGILEWFGAIDKKPQKVILVHGEIKQMTGLKKCLDKNFSVDALMPAWLDSVTISPSEKISVIPDKEKWLKTVTEEREDLAVYNRIKQNLKELINLKKGVNKTEDLIDDLNIIEKLTRKFLK